MSRPLVVGWSPGPNTPPDRPLENVPGSAGAALVRLTGLSEAEYMEAFSRINLHHEYAPIDYPSRERAHERAQFFHVVYDPSRPFVLLGSDVSHAYGHHAPWHEWRLVRGRWVARTPHPSGRNRWYNAPENVAQARAFWRRLLERGPRE